MSDGYPEETYFDLLSTEKALYFKENIIHTTQPSACSTTNIIDGYRIFVHMIDGEVVEIVLGGQNKNTQREIREGHNLEKLLLNGEFGKSTF